MSSVFGDVGYRHQVNNLKISLARQRLDYLTKGNFHGVSANWLAKNTDGLFPGVKEFIKANTYPVHVLESYVRDAQKIYESVLAEKSETNFGKNFDCEEGLASLLYAYIMTNKPVTILETGVANGITTNMIMRAIELTGGNLHSVDVDTRTRNVYSGKGSWNFHLLQKDYKNELEKVVSRIGKIDLWIHDSNHGYQWQAFEYRLAVRNLNIGGVLFSDDIDASTAWGLAFKSIFKKSFGVFDSRKFFGVATI